jgi:uncharacterized protein YecE (DUF72 family)
VTADWAYVRFHKGSAAAWRYSPAKLEAWADRIADCDLAEIFVYFNNDPGGAAIVDAIAFRELLAERRIDVGPRVGVPIG